MKTHNSLLVPCLIVAIALTLCACSLFKSSSSNTAVNTLGASEKLTSDAYSAYLALVVQGKVPTNNVPKISQAFNTFQALVTVTAASLATGTNAAVTPDVLTGQNNVINLISQEKAQ